MSSNQPTTDFLHPRVSRGTRLNGIYEIDDLIGIGGMGEIYKGHLVETGDPVAIKLMLPEFSQNEAAFTLFRKEASALHHLQHDAIVRYYVFTVEPVLRRPYLAMEFVSGRTLSELLHTDGPLTFEAAVALLRRLASGLQAAHERGIVHRDMSPDNIIVPNNDVNRSKIIDFGIAKTTQHGTIIAGGFAGKFTYVSPEQLGLFDGEVTPKSDIYSLGLVIAEALTGKPLDMGGTQFEVIEKRRKLPPLGAIDLRLRPLLERMLQPDPARRPSSMAEIAAWSFGAVPAARSAQPKHKVVRGTSRISPRRWAYFGAGIVLLLIAAGTLLVFRFNPIGPSEHPASGPSLAPPGSGATASRTPPPVPPPAESASMAEKIKAYIARYDGGACFFVTPVAVTNSTAALEGFGASIEPFRTFDTAFQHAMGFEADIGVHEITQQQCPTLAFLAGLTDKSTNSPHLDIDREELHNGEILSGMIDRYGSGNLALVLVSDGGVVQNLSSFLKPGTDAKTFQIGMNRSAPVEGRKPQLLLAISSTGSLPTLQLKQPVDAKQFFARLASETSGSRIPVSATARYFFLTN